MTQAEKALQRRMTHIMPMVRRVRRCDVPARWPTGRPRGCETADGLSTQHSCIVDGIEERWLFVSCVADGRAWGYVVEGALLVGARCMWLFRVYISRPSPRRLRPDKPHGREQEQARCGMISVCHP